MDRHSRRLIDEREAAELLGLSIRTLRKWRLVGSPSNKLPFRKLGRAVRYDVADISALVESSRRSSTSDLGGPESSHAA
jgi:predicted DNA-binding transcriptional regulator AlpA